MIHGSGADRLSARLLGWLPALAWMGVIFWFSSQSELPRPANDLLNLLMRKTAHLSEYAVLALLYVRALGGDRPLVANARRRRVLALIAGRALRDHR